MVWSPSVSGKLQDLQRDSSFPIFSGSRAAKVVRDQHEKSHFADLALSKGRWPTEGSVPVLALPLELPKELTKVHYPLQRYLCLLLCEADWAERGCRRNLHG